ncbi:MAG: HEAT repeat domain-containing protein, partial [Verrucomicrobiaceae bacterium]
PQRVHAAVELTQMLADRERTLPYVRQLATETKDPEVLAIGVRGLAWALDGDSVPIYLTAMEHEDSKVREAGVLAMKTIGGGTLGDGIFGPIGKKLTFAPGDPPESRRAVVKELRALYELRLADEAEYKAMEAAFRSGK